MPDTTALFTEEFNAELYTAFQNKGGVMRSRVRRKTGVVGYRSHFPKLGVAGVASGKTRHGKVPMLDISRDRVYCDLYDRYGADMVDDLDELKTNVAERAAIQGEIANSLARSEDDFALNAAALSNNAANSTGADDSFSSDTVPRSVLETFGTGEAMGEGMHALITWRAWADLLAVNSFINSDYGGDPMLTSEGQRPKMYFGFSYAPFSRLPAAAAGGTTKLNMWFNSRCVGVCVGKEITPETAWLSDYDAWFIKGKMSMGAILIDAAGVILRRYAS